MTVANTKMNGVSFETPLHTLNPLKIYVIQDDEYNYHGSPHAFLIDGIGHSQNVCVARLPKPFTLLMTKTYPFNYDLIKNLKHCS